MSKLRYAIYGSVLLLLATGTASAQRVGQGQGQGPGQAPGQAPGQGRGQGQDQTEEQRGAADTKPWSFSTSLAGSYNSNPMFTDGEAEADTATRAGVAVGRNWTMRRGDARLSVNFSRPFYHESTQLSELAYNVGGGVNYSLTKRLDWTFGSNVTSSLAQDAKIITDAGVLLPSVQATTGTVSTGLSYALNPRDTLSWSFSQQGVGFESTLFRGGQSIGTTVNLMRQVTRDNSLGVESTYSRSFTGEGTTQVQSYTGVWRSSIGESWTFFAKGGIRPYTIPGQAGWAVSPAVSAGISRIVREGQSVNVTYDRTIEQAFGLDRTHLVQTGAVTYSFAFNRRISGDFGGSYAYGTYPLLPDLKLIGELANAALSYRLISNIGMSLSGSYYRRTFRPDPPVSSWTVSFGVVYGNNW